MQTRPAAPIKLVIWDLDDTFWDGTLSEGEIKLIEANIEIVKILADRGIMSSIASKNELALARQCLAEAGVWDYFIFPQISWHAKGGSVTRILEQANLRPENVLFIDDNPINIEEVRFLFPTMTAAYPQDVLPVLLEMEAAQGKDDRSNSRLKQYKQLEQKVADQTQTSMSNEDFLRQCDIKLRFEFDIEKHLDRVVELINRSNQLNFTKIRIETKEGVADFKKSLQRYDISSAAIFASDRYGDHGLIGFYMQLKTEWVNRLVHFVWSCRMMNAGLEQYVFERLGEPSIEIVEPVANPIKVFQTIDWVKEVQALQVQDESNEDPKLLLLGGCDLMAVAGYCSRNRVEYVNSVKNDVTIRYDDFGFILADNKKVQASVALDRLPCWGKSDVVLFRDDLASSDVVIISLPAAMSGVHLLTDDGVVVRVHPDSLGNFIDFHPWADFLAGCKIYDLDAGKRDFLLRQSLAFIDRSSGKARCKFLLGVNTRPAGWTSVPADLEMMRHYNSVCEAFCLATPNWHFVSIDKVVTETNLHNDSHYTRIGYFQIANYINETIQSVPSVTTSCQIESGADVGIFDLVRSGRKVSRLALVGFQRGWRAHLKRAIKVTPMEGILRKTVLKRKKDPLLALGDT